MRKIVIAWPFVLVCLCSCSTTKPLTQGAKPQEIERLQLVEPVASIRLIEKRHNMILNDSLSHVSIETLQEVLKGMGNRIPITGDIRSGNMEERTVLNDEIISLVTYAAKHKRIDDLKLTPLLDASIESTGERFALIALTAGFTRAKGNYGKQIAKGMAIGILTMGMYVEQPIKCHSSLYIMIVDSQTDGVVFFGKSELQDSDPLDPEILGKQVAKVFKDYFPKEG